MLSGSGQLGGGLNIGTSYRQVNFDLFSGGGEDPGDLEDGGSQGQRKTSSDGASEPWKLQGSSGGGGMKLGTLMGVFVPCLQNILGVILFIRLSWIVGQAGVGQTLLVVGMCCLCTFLTSLSFSAIATNGEIKGGGPYFLIGHSLGPEVGVSVGICFYLGTSVAAAMYILGAVETILHSLRDLRIYTAQDAVAPSVEDYQIYGTVITLLVALIVSSGMQRLSKIAPVFLAPVLVSVLCIWIGVWTSSPKDGPGITGLKGSTIDDNFGSVYVPTDQHGQPTAGGSFTWGFAQMIALFFPSVTGIMAGSNRSACLKDAQDSIPKGTLGAQLTTTTIYLLSVVFFGGVATRDLLLRERLLAAEISWPVAELVYLGITLSTLGAALQSMSGAPRLLQAIANDRILPFLNFLACPEEQDPFRCVVVTALITTGCCLGGNLDVITPIITMFFLICYLGVNASCALLSHMNMPSWRPRFRYYHWSLSLVGAIFCLAIMLIISWVFTVVSFGVAALVYAYVSSQPTVDWGDGMKSMRIRIAISSMLSLGGESIHPKNWYPAPLVITKPWGLLDDSSICHPKLVQIATYFQPRGRHAAAMAMLATVLSGEYKDKAQAADNWWKQLYLHAKEQGFHGFVEVLCARHYSTGFQNLLQVGGLGNLRPNIVIMRYPELWNTRSIPPQMATMIRATYTSGKAMCLIKDLDTFPDISERCRGTIDLYWITKDGGLMLLLGEMFKKHPHFSLCKLRVFVIASKKEDMKSMEESVKSYLYQLRMKNATVQILDTENADVCDNCGSRRVDIFDRLKEAQKKVEHLKYAGAAPDITANESSSDVGSDRVMDNDETLYDEKKYPDSKIEEFLLQNLKLNAVIKTHSRKADLTLVSLPPPPGMGHPSHLYMQYLELLLDGLQRCMLVRGYKRDVVTIYQ